MKTLKITVIFDKSVRDLLNNYIEIPDSLAAEKHIKNGTVGALFENDSILKITYRGAIVELPKSKIRVVTVEEKSVFDF